MDEELLRHYKSLVEFLGKVLGSDSKNNGY